MTDLLEVLMRKGVRIPSPQSVEIGPDVLPERISGKGVTLHAGCKIFGAETWIHDGCRLGEEGPVTLVDVRLGRNVRLAGGYFRNTVCLEGATAGSGAHVRDGTILEESASIAHTVGLKQTILFPFVTLGSLINFCDCLMAGGTGRRNHSEVGSAYIHFNYTPNQDKATASLIGDVPRGVMLNRAPVFLGGQGGLVGPCRLAFGTVIAAGTIWRKDETAEGMLLFDGGRGGRGRQAFQSGVYRNVRRIVGHNLTYIANLVALAAWYRQVRSAWISEAFPKALLDGLIETLDAGVHERFRQFQKVIDKMPESIRRYRSAAGDHASERLLRQKADLMDNGPRILESLSAALDRAVTETPPTEFSHALESARRARGADYVAAVQDLSAESARLGTDWLDGIVDRTVRAAMTCLPSFESRP